MSPEENFARERFLFTSEALQDEHALHVVRFSGHEGLNELYSFELTVATTEKSLPLPLMLSKKGKFTILGNDTPDAKFSGFVTKIVQTSRYNDWTFYQLTLQPTFWYYTQTVQNNFFIGRTVQQLLDECLGKLESCNPSHEFKLEESYNAQPFSMQHNETLYDYMSWKMERDGIYYYFEEKDEGEHLVFTDSKNSHTPLDNVKSLRYSPTTGMENAHQDEVITSFAMTCSPLPQRVVLRDYDWRNPNTPVIAMKLVSEQGLGEVYYYGEGYDTVDEGNRLAGIRAEALRCRASTWNGTSAVPCLRPGRNFTLDHHYDDSFNREYTITSVTHEGSQEAHLSQALGVPIDNPDKVYYRNSFACIASDQQFRPERKTKRAKVSGMITAFIDSSNNSGIAEVNDEGCYKVYFPQDNSGRGAGNASCWIRRMQPHLGQGHGFTLPLAPGVEVLVAFMDGDPDRPVIAGAVSNAESGYTEHTGSSETTGLNTSGGNALLFNDKGAKQGMMLKTGARSGIMMSAGSIDAVLNYSDNGFTSYSCLGSQEAGMLNEVQAGFEQKLQADHGVFDLASLNTLWEAMNMAANVADWTAKLAALPEDAKDADKKTDAAKTSTTWQDALSTGASLFKTLKELSSLLSTEAEGEKYSSALSATDESAGLSLKTRMTAKDVTMYVFSMLFKNVGKLTTDAVALGLMDHDKNVSTDLVVEDDTPTAYDKHEAVRNYVAETVPTLVAEITAIIMTVYNRNKLFGKEEPKGILINSENGPLVAKTEENIVMLANDGMLLSAVPRAQCHNDKGEKENYDWSSHIKPSEIKDKYLMEDHSINIQASKIGNYSFDRSENISAGNITTSSPDITLTTKKITDKDDITRMYKIANLYNTAHFSDMPGNNPAVNSFKEYDKLNFKEYSEIQLKRAENNNKIKSNVSIKNINGSINIDNVVKEDSDKISILTKNKIDDKFEKSLNGISLSKNKIKYGFINKDKTTNITLNDNKVDKTETYDSINFQITDNFNSKAKDISFNATNEFKATAKNINLTANEDSSNIELKSGGTSLKLETGAFKVTSSLIKLGDLQLDSATLTSINDSNKAINERLNKIDDRLKKLDPQPTNQADGNTPGNTPSSPAQSPKQ